MAFVLGLIGCGVALWFLVRIKRRDTAHCREVLGLEVAPRETAKGTTPEGFAYAQRAVLRGTMLGRSAKLWERAVRHPRIAKLHRTGSQMTVLEFTLDHPVRVPLRIQPTGLLEGLETFVSGPAADRVPVDPAFDAAYVVYTDRATEAMLVLTPALREKILALRATVARNLPASTAGKIASGLTLGTFVLEGNTASYATFGSATRATAEHVRQAAPLLLELAAGDGG
jgi:hypothetical protein